MGMGIALEEEDARAENRKKQIHTRETPGVEILRRTEKHITWGYHHIPSRQQKVTELTKIQPKSKG